MNPRITIIDDDANVRIIAATLLELRDFSVRTLSGSQIDPASLDDTDLVLLDLETSGVNGLRTVQELHRQFDRRDRPRLIVAVPADAPDTERFAHRIRPDAILHKPFDPRALIRTVEELLGRCDDQPAADAG
ncbi:MAG: response regulator [Deltaproteobacteria bacterium]|nr:response regulator [Deltaproteobacteria bacterium]